MSNYRVWCLSWEDDEEHGKAYPDKPVVTGYIERILANDSWALDAKNAAEMYADYVHANRDGWESSWPLMFRVRCPDGTTCDFEVDREYVPEFCARSVEPIVKEGVA